ncbi:MAG: orotidine-5'-phosphate decarboxylase [Proteobacteria bacterium]|nr:orotidine-5'-phosphate decarboxylase [Pseudomonadota bacterium]
MFPLDVPTFDDARHYIRLLSGHVGLFKVGLELFIKIGPDIVRFIHDSGDAGVFLDLKLHDIPATVERAARVVGDLGVAFATVHCGESVHMLEAAVRGSNGNTKILGVTVLTSISASDIEHAGYKESYYHHMADLVVKRARDAHNAGCAGVVSSGLEVPMIKQACGSDFIAVTPGIRPLWDDVKADDQKRVTSPAQAILNGSDYLVIGRPIRDAKDPVLAAQRVADEILTVL